jgi:MYXO-CTERM domain-containing protein
MFSIDPSNIFIDNSMSVLSDSSITVSGASVGNGTFLAADFTNYFRDSPDPSSDFNLAENLVGQNGFGTTGGGNFTFFSSLVDPLAPDADGAFLLAADDRSGVDMTLTSLQEASAPEPAAMGLAGLGLLAMFAFFRRRAFASRVVG